MQIKKVGVLGCGLMGSGIAQVSAQAGYDVIVLEADPKALERGFAGIDASLGKFVERGPEKGGITAEQKQQIQSRLRGTQDKNDLAGCDLVIEAIIENIDEKKKTYSSLDTIVKKDAIFASNTSSISVTELMSATRRPERFIGLHFFNPVPLMPLVEVVRAVGTSPETVERAMTFVRRLGKEPIAARDRSGFVVNRLLVPYLLDAARALEQGVASAADIDRGMQLGCGHPMGPLALLDFVGLDTVVRIADIMFDEYREPRFAAPPLLRRMVAAGLHGRKSGRGFYDYASDPPSPIDLGL